LPAKPKNSVCGGETPPLSWPGFYPAIQAETHLAHRDGGAIKPQGTLFQLKFPVRHKLDRGI
jgi:hypothetical protein